MQWEGQDLHTQLFSPTGPAQEVPVSSHLTFEPAGRTFFDVKPISLSVLIVF